MPKPAPFYFGSTSDVEDGNGDDKVSSTIPYASDDEDEITDDVLDTDEGIKGIPSGDDDEDEVPVKKKSTKKKVEEVEEEDEEDELEDENDEDEEDEDLSSINLLATSLIDKGLLIPKEGVEYEDSEVGLAQLQEDTLEARMLENVPDEYASILDAIKQGIPASEWVSQVAPDEDLRNADLDDEDNQEVLVARASKLAGLSDTQITKKIDRLRKADMLKEEAEEAHATLVKLDEDRKAANNKKITEDRNEAIKKQAEFIKGIEKKAESLTEVQGVYLNRKTQKELVEYTTKPVNTRGETQYMIDRNDPELMLQAAFLVKNAKSNILQKVASSRATKSLKDKLDARTDRTSSGKGRTPTESRSRNRMSEGMPWDNIREVED